MNAATATATTSAGSMGAAGQVPNGIATVSPRRIIGTHCSALEANRPGRSRVQSNPPSVTAASACRCHAPDRVVAGATVEHRQLHDVAHAGPFGCGGQSDV